MNTFKRMTSAGVIVAMVSFGLVAVPPAEAQKQVGLVNVYVDDVLSRNNVTVQVAANIAAQICGLTAQVGVIAQQIQRTGNYRCTNEADGRTVQVTRAG